LEARLHPELPRHGHEAIPDVPGAIGDREELPRLLLQLEWDREALLDEPALLAMGPGEKELLEGVRGRGGHEARGRELRGKHVAAAAPAHEDLPAAVPGALEQENAMRRGLAGGDG